MGDFIIKYWIEIGFGLITTLFGFLWARGRKEVQKYKELIQQEQLEKFDQRIELKMAPLSTKLDALKTSFEDFDKKYINDRLAVRDGYRFRILFLCDQYITRGNITPKEYQQLSELFKVYEQMHGNGQAKERYEIAIHLPIKHDDEE